MNRRNEASQDEISTHPIGRLLALPAKGQRDRKLAIGTWGLLVGGTFTCLTLSTMARDEQPSPKKAEEPHGAKIDDAFRSAPAPGYFPTYLDGGGGIAGVPLTKDQREALIREARRRGLSTEDAYALAYGDKAQVHVHPDGTVHVHTGGVVVPNSPVYARMLPSVADNGEAPIVAAEEAPKDSADSKGQTEGAPTAPPAKGKPYYPATGKNLHAEEKTKKAKKEKGLGEKLKKAVPAPLEGLVSGADRFSDWLGAVSPGEAVVTGPVQSGNLLKIPVEAPVSADLSLRTTFSAPMAAAANVQPLVETVVTDTETGEVVAEHGPQACPNIDAVSGVAIGQAVDVVLEAHEESRAPDLSVLGVLPEPTPPEAAESPDPAARRETEEPGRTPAG
ncbi:hypothetical protein [Streptomyces antarcticus]|uniref:hypothetical protein n=1 Tax=Streptomyces antarcticus TaxID=2996458 RepID=UPI00226F89F0|nr:hypothetical protein [Streptomyces sp. H34-AA3]MCY0947158.1 hypothetical protein [Streptomyces sp. H34-AA3]